jgi:tetratricopeptide (TPR) repeat protein
MVDLMGFFDKFKKKDDADSFAFKAVKLTKEGKYEESLEFFDKALDLNPNKFQVLQLKGISLDELGRYEEALEAYDQALKIDPNSIFSFMLKVEILFKLERH